MEEPRPTETPTPGEKENPKADRWLRVGKLCLLELSDGTVYEFDFSCG